MAALDTSLPESFMRSSDAPRYVKAGKGVLRFFRTKPLGGFGALVLVLIMGVGAFSPWIATHDPNVADLNHILEGPSSAHWFGTDFNGRDYFSRIVFGCQVTAMVGLGTVILTAILSLSVGLMSGYFGGKFDFIIQRFVDIWLSFPAIFLILTLVAVLQSGSGGGFFGLGRGPEVGPNPVNGDWFWYTFPRTTIVILALGVVGAGGASRVIRSAVLGTKAFPYVEAAIVVGANHPRIILKHILPNIMPTVIVLATIQLGTAILAEATISFLGVGVTNFPTWGQMLSGRTRELAETHLYLVVFPGTAIFLAVFGFNMLGDALRDVLDPRLRGTR
ncbi:MAG: ABC transporter permease [Dehalococcoidia bacterium]|nr:ABC transporter permease [Dehalococcoidia bacterium]MCB9486598.1 ABC transporter permease [Thermoflexaceae bacterium]